MLKYSRALFTTFFLVRILTVVPRKEQLSHVANLNRYLILKNLKKYESQNYF